MAVNVENDIFTTINNDIFTFVDDNSIEWNSTTFNSTKLNPRNWTDGSAIDNSTSAWLFDDAESTESHHFPKDMLGFTAACAFIIAIFGTMGNLLTIFALPMCRKLRTTATAFVINLAVVELMFCVFILPMSGAQYAYLQHHKESLLSDRDCVFFAVARYSFTQTELQTILAIALTRAIAVGCPGLYRKIDNAWVTGIYIAGIWIYSFVIRIPTGLGIFGKYVFNNKTMECDNGQDPVSKFARGILTLFEAVIPVAVILILYAFIFIMVKKSTRRVARGKHKSPKPSSSSTAASSVSDEPSGGENGTRKASITSFRSLKRMMSDSSLKAKLGRRSSGSCISTSRRDVRVARTIFVIFLMVNVCSIPVLVIHGVDSESTYPRRFLAVHILYWLQFCLNLFVYVLMNRQYRVAYVEFLAKIIPSWERHKSFAFPWENPSVSSKPMQRQDSSFKSRKDSYSQDPSTQPIEYKPVDAIHPKAGQGRLSAILEVNSSSCLSNDDVFIDDKKIDERPKNIDLDDKSAPKDLSDVTPTFKKLSEEGTAEEKEHWITQNGETVHSPSEENIV